MIFRIFLTSAVLFCFFSFYTFATEQQEEYECIFDKGGPIIAPDNPYKEQYTKLSDSFLEKYPNCCSPSEKVLCLGDYEIYLDRHLGAGGYGDVFLGKYLPKSIYVAAKRRQVYSKSPKKHDEYRRLVALGQLYSLWIEKSDESICYAYFVIPLVDGKEIGKYRKIQPWTTAFLEEGVLRFSNNSGLHLVRSMFDQLLYIAKSGTHHDSSSSNIFISSDYNHVVLIDFGYPYDYNPLSAGLSPIKKSKFNAYDYAYYCTYLLGIRYKHREELKNGNIEGPEYIVNFLKLISNFNGKFDPVYLDTFEAAVEELERQFEATTVQIIEQ
jgi:hypothetical protein